MEFKGKKIAFLGDSITYGVGASSIENSYVGVVAKEGGVQVLNYGVSGTRIARQKIPSSTIEFDECFKDRAMKMPSDIDIIVVFGGTNDFGHGDARFGCFDDRDEYSFYGALHSLLQTLIEKYPYSHIVFMTPMHRLSELNTVNEIGLPCHQLQDYVSAIREVCAYYSIPVLDLFANSGIQPAVPVMQNIYMPDGLHPSDAGAMRVAKMLLAYLRAL